MLLGINAVGCLTFYAAKLSSPSSEKILHSENIETSATPYFNHVDARCSVRWARRASWLLCLPLLGAWARFSLSLTDYPLATGVVRNPGLLVPRLVPACRSLIAITNIYVSLRSYRYPKGTHLLTNAHLLNFLHKKKIDVLLPEAYKQAFKNR